MYCVHDGDGSGGRDGGNDMMKLLCIIKTHTTHKNGPNVNKKEHKRHDI